MADNLRLRVILDAIDRASAPFRKIMAGSKGLAATLLHQREALKRLNAAQRDISAFRQQTEAARGVRAAHEQAQTKVKQLAAQIAAAQSPSRKLNNEFKDAKRTAALLKAQHVQQATSLQRLRTQLEGAGISTRQLGAHERRLRSEIAGTTAQMELQRKRLATMAAAKARAAKIHSAGMNAGAHGAGMAFGGIAALRAEMFPLAKAISFESAMADVKKVVDFPTPAAFEKMGEDIEDLSLRLPMLPEAIAAIVAAAGQASIPRQELLRFAEDAAKMGVAFDTSAEDSGQTMATWRTAFRMGQSEVVVLADKINYLGNTGTASVQKISEVVNRIGALGEVAGLGSGPLAALGSTVAGMGIESEVSATGIKNMLLTLAAGEAATKGQRESFSKLGLSASAMAKAMQDDAAGAIVLVLQKLQKLPKAEQASTMTKLFGRESIGAIAPLLTNLELLQENFAKVADAQRYGGSMESEYAARVATSANSLQLLKNSALVVSQSIGKTLIPDFKVLVEDTAVFVGNLTGWIRRNRTLVAGLAKLVIGGTALITVLGGLLVAGGVTAMALTQIHKAVMLLSGGGGFGALVGRVVALGSNAFPMLLNVGRVLLGVLGGVSAPVLAIGAAVAVVAALVWRYWGPIKAFMIGTWQGINDVIKPILVELKASLAPLAPVWSTVADAMGSAWAWAKKLFEPFNATSEQLQGATDNGREFGRILGAVLTLNLKMAVKAIGWLVSAFMVILPIIRNTMSGAWSYLQGMWSLIMGLFTLNGDKIRGGVQSMWNGVNTLLVGWPARMRQAGVDMITGLIGGVASMASAARDAVGNVATGVMSRFKGLLGIHSPSRVFAQFGAFTMQGLASGLDRAQDRPLQQVVSLADRMRQIGSGITLGSSSAFAPALAARVRQLGAGIALSAATAPVLASMAPAQVGASASRAGAATAPSSININIYPPPGADPQAIGREVRRQLEAYERDKQARRTSRLTD